MTDEQSGHDKRLSETQKTESKQDTRRAAEEREGMARHERSALPTEEKGEKPGAGYWEGMDPEDSSDMSMNKSRFGVFEKESSSGPTVIKPGRDFGKGKDPRSLNQSGVYAEKDATVWQEMKKSVEGEDAEWCGTPSDDTCEVIGAPTGTSKREAKGAGGASEESAPGGTQGQHWRGEPWSKNPKVGGKEAPGTGETGTQGQHWRGDELPPEKKGSTGTTETRGMQTATRTEESGTPDDRPDEC